MHEGCGAGHAGHRRPGRAPASLCARRGQRPACRPALRHARGPDLSGAVLLPSPRQANPLARVNLHCRNTSGTGAPLRRPALRQGQKKGLKNMGRTQHHTEAQVVVTVVGLIPVAAGTARVVSRVVPRTAAHDLSRLPGRVLPPGARSIAKKSALRAAGEVSPAPPAESELPE